jgi:hypothetical protein
MLFSFHRVLHKQKDMPGGHASGTAKYPAGSPSTLKQAILCLTTAPSLVLTVTGQF